MVTIEHDFACKSDLQVFLGSLISAAATKLDVTLYHTEFDMLDDMIEHFSHT